MSQNDTTRLYLKVPYNEKDDAKTIIHAMWDNDKKLWYCLSLLLLLVSL